jgi:hypothetical protein
MPKVTTVPILMLGMHKARLPSIAFRSFRQEFGKFLQE